MQNSFLDNNLSVLVLGFDPYQDVWPYFDYFYTKNCLDLSKNLFFVSVSCSFHGVSPFTSVQTNGKYDFSSRLNTGLRFIHTKYVFLILEDYIFSVPVNVARLSRILAEMDRENFSFCELQNFIKKPRLVKNDKSCEIREIRSPGHYRISMQPAFWRSDFLTKLSENSISRPWDFEILLSRLYDNSKPGAYPKAGFADSVSVLNFVDKGKITWPASSLINKCHLQAPARDVQNYVSYANNNIRLLVASHTPSKVRIIAKKIGRKIGKHYFSDN